MMCPLQSVAKGNFWGDKKDTEMHDLQTPSATQTSVENNTPTETATVKKSITNSDKRTIKNIEILGNNVIDKSLILQQMKLQEGDTYSRELIQRDLKAIYQLGYFTENMKAIPINNSDGSITLKIVLEENTPVTDFTIEGNTVISTDEILTYLLPMKGKPQNIAEINDAIAKIQDCYSSKGYILARIDSVSDDPDGTVNISIKEGTINRILISGNEKTKDYVIERNILTEPGQIYNENLLKEDLVRLYATQAFKDVTREIEPTEDPDKYDITINIEEQRTASISVGGGIQLLVYLDLLEFLIITS